MPNDFSDLNRDVDDEHFSLAELSEKWKLSRKVLTRLFESEPGVVTIRGQFRQTLRIPAPVAERVYRRLEIKN